MSNAFLGDYLYGPVLEFAGADEIVEVGMSAGIGYQPSGSGYQDAACVKLDAAARDDPTTDFDIVCGELDVFTCVYLTLNPDVALVTLPVDSRNVSGESVSDPGWIAKEIGHELSRRRNDGQRSHIDDTVGTYQDPVRVQEVDVAIDDAGSAYLVRFQYAVNA